MILLKCLQPSCFRQISLCLPLVRTPVVTVRARLRNPRESFQLRGFSLVPSVRPLLLYEVRFQVPRVGTVSIRSYYNIIDCMPYAVHYTP